MKHIASAVETAYGWKGQCSCGMFALGFFSSDKRAKRAIMNSSHGDEIKQPDRRVINGNLEVES